jgi:hypothetical protein
VTDGSWKRKLERTLETVAQWRKAAVNRLTPVVSRIIPGDWGKVGPGWLARSLSSRMKHFGGGGRIHQFLWRRSRVVSTREKGTVR